MEAVVATVVRDAEESVILASGEIDVANCDQLFAAVEPELGSDRRVVVDLSAVTFMDSSCLNVLILALGRQDELGGTFVLRSPSPVAMRLLTLTGLDFLIR